MNTVTTDQQDAPKLLDKKDSNHPSILKADSKPLDKNKNNNTKFHEMVNFITRIKPLTFSDKWSLFPDIRKAFEYIYSQANKDFPYKNG
jgi:hypothetical protein